jgi:hypothetical protein
MPRTYFSACTLSAIVPVVHGVAQNYFINKGFYTGRRRLVDGLFVYAK